MSMNGTDVLIMVNTGTDVAPVWTAVGSQRDATFEETTEEIDVSSKDSREKEVLAGRYSASVSLDGLYVPTDTAYLALQNAMRSGDTVQIARNVDTVNEETATAVITSLSENFPDQDGATVSISLVVDGDWA